MKKLTFSPGEVLEQVASLSAIEVGIVMNFVLYGAGRPLTELEMQVLTDRIAWEYAQICGSGEAFSAVHDAIARFGIVDEYKRTSFLPELFKAEG
jgi:hypothetical protein